MTDSIRLVIQVSIPTGRAAELKSIQLKAIDLCREKDSGLLSYEFFFNDVESEMYAVEWYKDSAAVLAHLGMVGEILNKLMDIGTITRAEVFGDASAQLIEAFEPFKASFFKHWDGFTR